MSMRPCRVFDELRKRIIRANEKNLRDIADSHDDWLIEEQKAKKKAKKEHRRRNIR